MVCYCRPNVYAYMPNFIRMCSLCRLPVAKNHNSRQILNFRGLLYPITDESQIWCATADPLHSFTCQNLSRSVYSISLWRRKPPFFGFRHLVMSTVGGNLRKLNTGAQLQTFPYPTASSKSFLLSLIHI